MEQSVPFSKVLSILESHGWRLKGHWLPYRVFVKDGQLPLLVEVRNKTVSVDDVQRIKEILATAQPPP